MPMIRVAALTLVLLFLAACGGTQSEVDSPAVEAEDKASAPFRSAPDFGGVSSQSVEADGVAATEGDAVLRALDSAIAQVNGRRVASGSETASAGLTIDVNGSRQADIRSGAYADLIVSSSRGAVRSFKVLSSDEISQLDAEREMRASASGGGWLDRTSFEANSTERSYSRYWKVRVRAEVAHFESPKDDGRPSLVVAMARHADTTYAVGDVRVAAVEIANELRRRLVDAITQSNRFVVLDRELSSEMQQEIDFINTDNARTDAVARLGQQLAADLILVPSVERFEYPRTVQKLRMSDRKLVSYSGGARLSLRLLNAATGEVVLSQSFAHELPSTTPSTMPRVVDGPAVADQLMAALSERMVRSITGKIFPVSVIALSGGQAALSQGGQAVAVGEEYQVVLLGQELKDPQTGRSLGRMETPCCRLRVDRVVDQTSYGTLIGALPPELAKFAPGLLELREPLQVAVVDPAIADVPASGNAAPAARAAVKPVKPTQAESVPEAKDDDADW